MAVGLEYLPNYQPLYPSLSGFVSNTNWRQCALKRIKSCHQPNNMPYPKWLLTSPVSIFLNWQELLCCLLTPSPQSTGQARAARSERRGVGGLQARFPPPHGARGSQSHFLCLVRWSCRKPLLSPPLLSALQATSLTIRVPPQPGEATVSPSGQVLGHRTQAEICEPSYIRCCI